MGTRRVRARVTLGIALLLAVIVVSASASLAASAAPAPPSVAFIKGGDVWTVVADGSGLQQLTTTAEYDLAPAWSPKRTNIAFIRSVSGNVYDRRAKLMLMRSNGTNERRLAYRGPSMTSGTNALAYSPSGRYLAGGTSLRTKYGYGTLWAITVLDLRTKRSRTVARYYCQNGIQSLSWSPNGKQLIATIEYGGGYGLLKTSLASRNRLVKDSGFGNIESVSWRGDGKYLLCDFWMSSKPDYPHWTYLVKPNGTKVKRIGDDQRFPVYSPNGQQYAFLRPVPYGACALMLASANGSNETTLVEDVDFSIAAWK